MGRKDKKKKKQQRKKERQRTATKQCTGEQVSDSGGASYPVGATGGQSMPDDKTVEKEEDTQQSDTSNTTRPTLGSNKQGKDDQARIKPIAPVAPAAALDSITSGDDSIASSYIIGDYQSMNSRSTNSRDEDFAEKSYTRGGMEGDLVVRGPPSGSRPRLKFRAYRDEEIEMTTTKTIH